MVMMLMINIFFILLCFKFLLLYAWWQLSGDTKSFSDQPSASLCTFVPSSEGYSNEWDTSCRLACFRQTCSVPVLLLRTVATLCTQNIIPYCPPSSCNTDVSSAPQLAALPQFCSSPAYYVVECLHIYLSISVKRLKVSWKLHQHFLGKGSVPGFYLLLCRRMTAREMEDVVVMLQEERGEVSQGILLTKKSPQTPI